MLFNSIAFAVFFPVVTILFFLFPYRFRWMLLLAASCFFYMFFKPVYIFILIFTIIIDYFAGIWIARVSDKRKKKYLLLLSIAANLSVLAVFKYFNFIAANINEFFSLFHIGASIPFLDILLPIGLSFHTMQAMSYNIEIYRGHQQPEKHFGIYALYIMFYPQLVAGPIERPQHMLHQFHEEKKFDYENMKRGLILIAWGLFKKVVIADRLAFFVNPVFNDPHEFKGISLIIATLFFSFQIYCDFSGYSDIAIGSAKCMGFDLVKNFERPYLSSSFREFWKRWHISLSSWFRDYLYLPLGGNHVSYLRWCFNILVVFLVSGLWHGASWTFVIWGLLHGIYLIVERRIYDVVPRLQNHTSRLLMFQKRCIVFLMVSFAWIFFRSPQISSAWYVARNLFSGFPAQLRQIYTNENHARFEILYIGQTSSEFIISVLLILLLMVTEYRKKDISFDLWLSGKPAYVRWPVYYSLVLAFIFLGIFNKSAFIYFQF